jgi:hypothetical protein
MICETTAIIVGAVGFASTLQRRILMIEIADQANRKMSLEWSWECHRDGSTH